MNIETIPFIQATRNELITSFIARCPISPSEYIKSKPKFLMDKPGEGAPIILSKSKELLGRYPKYREVAKIEF